MRGNQRLTRSRRGTPKLYLSRHQLKAIKSLLLFSKEHYDVPLYIFVPIFRKEPMSMRKQSGSTVPPTGGNADDILKETRKLLNALNDENSELKQQNNALTDKLRRTGDALMSATEEKDALEKDMKQINFNLMQQLRTKSSQCKELEQKVNSLQESLATAEKSTKHSTSEREDLEADLHVTQERVMVLEDANQKLNRQIAEQATQLDQVRRMLTEAKAAQRDSDEMLNKERKQFSTERYKLEEQLVEAQNKVHDVEFELQTLNETVTRECASLVADAKRAKMAESEMLFAHDQMANISVLVRDYLTEVQQTVRGMSNSCGEADVAMSNHLEGVKQLQSSFRHIVEQDELVLTLLLDERRQLESELQLRAQELSAAGASLKESRVRESQLESENRTLGGQLDHLHKEVESLSHGLDERLSSEQGTRGALEKTQAELRSATDVIKQLQSKVGELERTMLLAQEESRILREEMSREKAHHDSYCQQLQRHLQDTDAQMNDERKRWEADRARYEDELESLQQQLRDHTETLAAALGRLTTSSSMQRSMSLTSYHRSISVDTSASNTHFAVPRSQPPPLPTVRPATTLLGKQPDPNAEASHSPQVETLFRSPLSHRAEFPQEAKNGVVTDPLLQSIDMKLQETILAEAMRQSHALQTRR